MPSLNKMQIIGRLGNDPEIRHMPNGTAVANISVATSESWKDKQTGEKKEHTEWHRVSFFGVMAELTQKYLQKGSLVFIEGSLHTRKWKDAQGNDKYSTEIKGRDIQFLSPKNQDQAPKATPPPIVPGDSNQGFDDDIPFN